jgi:hypothetical protein
MNAETFVILLSRLPKVDEGPGLIFLTVDAQKGTEPPRRMGALTDAALRGRLSDLNLHSANEVAAIRQALSKDKGQATIYESWSGFGKCLQFWCGFVGSQIRPISWTCEKCGLNHLRNVGGKEGESFSRRCKCGQVKSVTIAKADLQIPVSTPSGAGFPLS